MKDITVDVIEAEERFEELLEMAENGRKTFITKDGKPLVVLMPYRESLEENKTTG